MTQAVNVPRTRGSLAQVAVAGIIRTLHAGRRSGVLHLTRGDVSKRLYFRAGSIIMAGSDQPEDRLGQALVRSGLVKQADLEKALRVVDATDRTIGEAFVQMGLLRPEQVQVEAARRTRQIVATLLDWDSGEYVFEERNERLEGEVLSQVDVPEVLLEWARGARGGGIVRQLLEDGKSVVQRPEQPSPTLGGLSLTASEQWALEQANGVSSAEEIAARSPMGEHEALRSICGLLLAGVLVARSPKAPPTSTQLYLGPEAAAPGPGTGLWAALEAEKAAEQAEASGFGTTSLSRKLPQSLGRYVVESAIGRGSMGAVLLARDPAIDRRVAVKLIQTSVQLTPNEWEKYKERFYREARAAGKLLHQGIVAIFDVGHTVEGVPFIVMEYVEGRTLAALAEEREVSLDEALRLAIECLDALDYAHSQGVIHRDLKPANIMITADGRPKIMDFGVAHVVGSQMTQADEILGSPHFMAPEQLGKAKVDQRTDLFAFGVVLYWMLTGLLAVHGRLLRRDRPGDPVGTTGLAQGPQADGPAGARQGRAALPREGPGSALRDRARAARGAAADRAAATVQPAPRGRCAPRAARDRQRVVCPRAQGQRRRRRRRPSPRPGRPSPIGRRRARRVRRLRPALGRRPACGRRPPLGRPPPRQPTPRRSRPCPAKTRKSSASRRPCRSRSRRSTAIESAAARERSRSAPRRSSSARESTRASASASRRSARSSATAPGASRSRPPSGATTSRSTGRSPTPTGRATASSRGSEPASGAG